MSPMLTIVCLMILIVASGMLGYIAGYGKCEYKQLKARREFNQNFYKLPDTHKKAINDVIEAMNENNNRAKNI